MILKFSTFLLQGLKERCFGAPCINQNTKKNGIKIRMRPPSKYLDQPFAIRIWKSMLIIVKES